MINPLELFSSCQANFIRYSSLETKIQVATVAIFDASLSYLVSCYKMPPLKNVEPYKAAAGIGIATYFILSTIIGYMTKNPRT
jgi:hypothetical protein